MNKTQVKTNSQSAHLQMKTNQSFFAKQNKSDFFSKGNETSNLFFRSATIQRKLTIGEPNDKYEKEADSIADKVVQRLAKPETISRKGNNIQAKPINSTITQMVQAKCASCEAEEKLQKKEDEENHAIVNDSIQKKPIFESNAEPPDEENNIQRKCAACEKEEKLQKKADHAGSTGAASHIEQTLNSSKGGGIPMPVAEMQQMENSFGADFSKVRLHTDNNSIEMNRSLQAQAFTHGSNIYFNAGKYSIHSQTGQHLLAQVF